jgi:hypothetical protein
MVSPLFFSQLVLVGLVWRCVMLQWAWPSERLTGAQKPSPPLPPPPALPRLEAVSWSSLQAPLCRL